MADDAKKKTRTSTWVVLFAIIGFFGWAIATSGNSKPASSPSPTVLTVAQQQQAAAKKAADDAQKVKLRQDTIAAVAPTYCNNHRKIQMGKVEALEKDGWPVFSSIDDVAAGRGIHGFTAAQCNTIITKFYDLGTPRDELDGIAASKIWVGMTYIELTYSVGFPDNINSTTTAAGTSQQWVYGTSLYAYVDGGKVTSYQQM